MARQIKVIVGTVIDKKNKIVSSDVTLRSVFKSASVDYGGKTVQIDGVNLQPGDLDKTFDQMNVTGDETYLIAVTKGDNA